MSKTRILLLVFSCLLLMVSCQIDSSGSETIIATTSRPEPTDLPPVVEIVTPVPTSSPVTPETNVHRQSPSPESSPGADEAQTTMTTSPPTVRPTSLPPERPSTGIRLNRLAEGFTKPTFLTHAGDSRLFVVEQAGRILIITKGTVLSEPFLDIRGRVNSNSLEQGLLSVAFHPNYSQNGQIYVNYTNLQGNTVVARYLVRSDDHNIADPNGETVLLTIAQPHANHNGGQVSFGPDGALYIGMGDGGSAGDPSNHGQDRSTLLGAMLRLDVDSNEPYALRTDNPFLGMSSVRNEIWATGLRNPWRFSFDRLTGDLYVADVGQNLWEEVNFQHAGGSGGENYGWRVMEASYCYASDSCDMAGLTMPVGEYSHQEGCSVTGGYVYRGQAYPELRGNYFFGDYCTGNVWSLFHNPDGSWQQALVLKSGINISSFGEDAAGELYLLDYVGGIIYQIGS